MLSIITLTCPICDLEFSRNLSEYRRTTKRERPSFCSRSCAGKANRKNIPESTLVWSQLEPGNRKDEFSPFRALYGITRKRALFTKREFNLTLEDLSEIWESQKGICPYTGWQIILPATSTEYNRIAKLRNPRRASIDRIDSSKGYVKENVQIVCHMANVAKNEYSHEQMIEFCTAIAIKHSGV